MTPANFARIEGFESHEARRKRLGQYYSGLPISKLLVALAARPGIKTVIDPMAGKGDMLVASHEILRRSARFDAVEIDPVAEKMCADALSRLDRVESLCALGSAFDPKTIDRLHLTGYDLVVTNPPYVRYQSQKIGAGASARLPSALEVRNGLRDCLMKLKSLTDGDRDRFLSLTEGYSGLSDLAVPAWILCAALVKPGGTLAMVVPDAWLNRDYASVVQYLLLRWFRIEFIVEDSHASWFSDALVRTTLVVARRISRRPSANNWTDETYLRIALPSGVADESSLIGRSTLARVGRPEIAFARRARQILSGHARELCADVSFQRVFIADHASALHAAVRGETWYRQIEPPETAVTPSRGAVLPPSLAHALPRSAKFTTLAELGVSVGQGLRTGANDFFYVRVIKKGRTTATVRLSKLFDNAELVVPATSVLPVVRKQTDVPAGSFAVNPRTLGGGVLALQSCALPEEAGVDYSVLSNPLAAHIRNAANTYVGEGAHRKLIPAMTAVAPNVRKANRKTGAPRRFWYMLPDFAARHRPDVFVARVNSDQPRAVMNPRRVALVDANFATLWLNGTSSTSADLLIAYLNSTLGAALFEHSGSVMGGGALKVEATHLASFPIPVFSASSAKKLASLGKNLAFATSKNVAEVRTAIDAIVYETVFGSASRSNGARDIAAALKEKLAARQHRK